MARDREIAAALFALLLGFYLLVYIPRVDSIDGQAILAVSASLSRTGTFQIGQIGAQDSLLPQQMARMGAFGLDGAYYSKKGLTPSLLLVPVVWLADALRLDLRALAMLFNPVVTALTGVMLYGLVRQLGYAARTGIITALLYGLATFALVYTKTLYAEPLAALLLTVAVKNLLQRGRGPEKQRPILNAKRQSGKEAKQDDIEELSFRLPLCRDATAAPSSPSNTEASRKERGSGGEVIGLCLGLLMGINLAYAALVPVVVGWVVIFGWAGRRREVEKDSTQRGKGAKRQSQFLLWPLRLRGAFLLPVFICAALIAVYNLARFGALTSTGYHFAAGEGFTRPFLEGFAGQLISPYRGLLWYNPLLLLALPGWLMLRRARPAASWLVLALIVAGVSIFSTWWSWEGGIAWGARFTLTITPLVAVCLAPLVQAASHRLPVAGFRLSEFPHRDDSNQAISTGNCQSTTGNPIWVALPIIGLTLLSLLIQLLGAGYSLYPYVEYLYRFGERGVLYNPLQSAVIGHLALASAGWSLEPAWIARGVNLAHGLIALLLIAAATAYIARKNFTTGSQRSQSVGATRRVAPTEHLRHLALNALSAPLLLCLSAVSLFFIARLHTPDISPVREMAAALDPPGRVLVASTHFDESLLDLPLRHAVISINAPTTPDDVLAYALTQSAFRTGALPCAPTVESCHLTGGGHLWLVTWFPPASPENWQERDLWACCAFALERSAAGHRVLLFSLTPPPQPDQPVNLTFGEQARLTGYGTAQTAEGLLVTLAWEAGASVRDGSRWFVHLLDEAGNILAQQDRAPAGGFALLSQAAISDYLFFPDVSDGAQLRIGWVDGAGQPLLVLDVSGAPTTATFILLDLP
jgi:hypothetical protein